MVHKMPFRRRMCIGLPSGTSFKESFTVKPPVEPWPHKLTPRALISLISRQADVNIALQIFEFSSKYQRGFSHTFDTYAAIIEKLSHARAFTQLESVLSQLLRSVVPCREALFISIIRDSGLAKKPAFAFKIFTRIKDFSVTPTARSLNALLNAFVRNKKYKLAHSTFRDCKAKFNITPDVATCNILLKAMCEIGDIESSLKLLDEMLSMGLVPNVVSYTTLLSGYCSQGDMEGARNTFTKISESRWPPDATAYTVLMYGYSKLGMLSEAVRVMDEMVDGGIAPNEVTYGVIIEAFCRGNKPGEARNLFVDMLERGYMPNSALLCKVVDALCQAGKALEACDLYKKTLSYNCMHDETIVSTIVYWLCKEGKAWDARNMFKSGEGLCGISYDTMICGMCEMGELGEAGRVWDVMVEKGLSPSWFSYKCMIVGFCGKKNGAEAAEIVKEMVGKGMEVEKSMYISLIRVLMDQGMREELGSIMSLAIQGGAVDSDFWDVMLRGFVENVHEGLVSFDGLTASGC